MLLIDDADAMPPKLFDELLMLCNIARGGVALVHLVLAGGVHLEEAFATPQMASFQQRLAARVYLDPLNREESERYVRSLFASAGGDPEIFTPEALRVIRQESDGLPRVIHQIANQTLIVAAEKQAARITVDEVLEALSELQQFPATPRREAPSPIEFGELDDFDEDFDHETPAPDNATPDAEYELNLQQSDTDYDLPELGHTNPDATLEALERRLRDAQEDSDHAEPPAGLMDLGRDHETATGPGPDAEKIGTPESKPQDVFGWFESEEIVIDRFASLDFGGSVVGGYVTAVTPHPASPWLAIKRLLDSQPGEASLESTAVLEPLEDESSETGTSSPAEPIDDEQTDAPSRTDLLPANATEPWPQAIDDANDPASEENTVGDLDGVARRIGRTPERSIRRRPQRRIGAARVARLRSRHRAVEGRRTHHGALAGSPRRRGHGTGRAYDRGLASARR